MNRALFLRLLLIDSLFGCALVAGGLAYPHIHWVATIAIAVVLAAFAAGAAVCLYVAWRAESLAEPNFHRDLRRVRKLLADVGELAEKLPGLALMGTAAGFLIALSGDPSEVQHRIAGAATGIVSTFVGVACWLVLSLQWRMLARDLEA